MSDANLRDTIVAAVQAGVADANVAVQVEGNRALIEVSSPVFEGMSRVNRQRTVYACIEDLIADGTVHAVTIRATE